MKRRAFLFSSAAALVSAAPKAMKPKQRVDAALAGQEPDRPPFTFWHHFHLEAKPTIEHAGATLDFQRKFRLDVVKVMSDYPYPKGHGTNWWELKEEKTPFPAELEALKIIRDGLAGQKYFVETIFNPYNVARKLSSKEQVQRLQRERPQALLDALEVIAKSEANHARAAIALGAAGVYLAIDNAQTGILTPDEYKRFSEPFDRMILEAVPSAPMNTLHLHGDKVYLDYFVKGWPASIISYSSHGTGVSVSEMRKKYDGVLMAGLDEKNFRTLGYGGLKRGFGDAFKAAGNKWICAPGCSVPDDSTDEEMLRVTQMFGA
jgi:uroporphyrinogen decarboxylase